MSSGKVAVPPIASKSKSFFRKTTSKLSNSFKVPSNPSFGGEKHVVQSPVKQEPLVARVKADIAAAEALRAEHANEEPAEEEDVTEAVHIDEEAEEADETILHEDDDEEPLKVEKSVDENVNKPAEAPAAEKEEPAEEPTEEPTEEPIEEPTEEPTEEPAVQEEDVNADSTGELLTITVKEPSAEIDGVNEEPTTKIALDEEADENSPTAIADSPKNVPLAAPPIVIPENIKSKPKLVGKYRENLKIASQVLNKNNVVNTGRRIDLGGGLILTEDQIYELARKKLEPVMHQIDDRVAENLKKDADVAAKVEEGIKVRDEGVVSGILASYKSCVDDETAVIQKTHDDAFAALELKDSTAKKEAEEYVQTETTGVETDATDAEQTEIDAVAAHISQKENLVATIADLKKSKTEELESTKAKQIEETDLAEKLESEGQSLTSKADDLENEVAEKKAALEAKIKQVEALISSKTEKKESIRTVTKKRKINERAFGILSAKTGLLASNASILGTQVGLMNSRVAAHDTKINHFNTTGKEALQSKKVDASQAKTNWDDELKQMRLEEAQKQERLKIEAEEERKRIEQEKIEEEARISKEKENAILEAEKKKKEEEAAIALHEEEIARAKKLKELREEKLKLDKEAEKSSSFNIGSATVGALGTAAGAAGIATGIATTATSNVASAAGTGINTAGDVVSKAVENPFSDSKEIHVIEEEKEEVPSTITGDGNTHIPTATSDSTADVPQTPVRRRSMVDEALANMTPDQVKRMNTPLKDLYPKEKASPAAGTPMAESGSLSRKNSSRSRSGSLSLFKKNKSRTNSLKQSSSELAAEAAASKKSNISSPTKKNIDPLKDIDMGATQSIGEAKKVPIQTHAPAEKFDATKKSAVESNDEESLSEPTTGKPVFTETIGEPAAPAATPENYENDDFVEVSTLETIDSVEYRAHKDDPNYMVIKK